MHRFEERTFVSLPRSYMTSKEKPQSPNPQGFCATPYTARLP